MTVQAAHMPSDTPTGAQVEPPKTLRGRALRLAHLAWWLIFGAIIVLTLAALPLNLDYYHQLCQAAPCSNQQLTRQQMDNLLALGLTADFYAVYMVALSLILTGAFLLVAPIIFLRKPNERVALFVSFTLAIFGSATAPSFFDILSQANPIWWFPTRLLAYIGSVAIIAFLYLFPSGEFVPRWTRAALVLWAVEEVPGFFFKGTPLQIPDSANTVFFMAFILSGILAQLYRYRRVSNAAERRQTKWVVFGVTVALGGLLAVASIDLLFNPPANDMALYLLASTLFVGLITLIPTSIGIAILRSHLWDIDLLINRTLVYVPLTAILAGIFSASISLTQKIFIALTGQQSDAAAVITTLIVVAAFTPIKDSVQTIVYRYFKEAPDPAKKLNAFGERVRTRLYALDRAQTLRRLLEESVAAFDAAGGAAYAAHDGELKLIHTVGKWTGSATLSAAISTDRTKFGQVSLGPSPSGAMVTLKDREAFEHLAELVAIALEQDYESNNLHPSI
jgi:hypothetical protein